MALRRYIREALPGCRQRGILAGEVAETVHNAVAKRRFESDEHEAIAAEHVVHGGGIEWVGAQDAVAIDEPEVIAPGHRCGRHASFSSPVCGGGRTDRGFGGAAAILRGALKYKLDFRAREAGDLRVELHVRKRLEFDRKGGRRPNGR